ncbi:hypothetical protein [Allorhodopirellula solitaria]|uniref:Secreted protein n=1 Tax=Allorhodopirellula solitaria TaxID=2527987 RepID=A0A5C5XUK2_9BACT|nr:hypothetical protein [Allorhodopirellula solitaria]TWT66398.1 hypothetical protein CA85_24920 [Allorhodopirellula solitaria]
MAHLRFRFQTIAVSFTLLSALALTTGCQPPREQAITTEDGEVATEFSDDMVDDGTPVPAEELPGDEQQDAAE